MRIFVTLIFLLSFLSVHAQTEWESAGIIYKDNFVTVNLEYRIYPNLCNNNSNRTSKFRYRITGTSRDDDYYLNWKMDYYNCNGSITCQTNVLNIGKSSGADEIQENMDWTFLGYKLETPFYEVKSSYTKDKTAPFIKPLPKLIAPQEISGVNTISYGELVTLTVKGGNLPTGAKWVWYEDQCEGRPIGTGSSIKVTPLRKKIYFVRGESSKDTSDCISHPVDVLFDSKAADKVLGKSNICKGDKDVELLVDGGKLGKDAAWIWYKGSCGGFKIGQGTSIKVSPTTNTTYYVRAEGSTYVSECKSIDIKINDLSLDPEKVDGLSVMCDGYSTDLKVIGGKLAGDAEWVWYKNSLMSTDEIGRGIEVNVAPEVSTIFYVRGEGGCNNTASRSISIQVNKSSKSPYKISSSQTQVYEGKKINLSVVGGSLGESGSWVWYKKSCGTGSIGTGEQKQIKLHRSRTVFVRAEDDCGNTDCVSQRFKVLRRFTFINFGVVANASGDMSKITSTLFTDKSTYAFTFGNVKKTGWYIKGKFNLNSISKTNYECNETALLNYFTTDTYYKFNGKVKDSRLGATAGFVFGPRNLMLYIGGGYGIRNLQWGIDEYSYLSGTKTSENWAKYTDKNVEGAEVEGGLLLRLSFINIIAGASAVNFKYFDAHAGIGFNF